MDQQPPQATPSPTQPTTKKQNGFFSLLGKLFLVLLVAGALLGGGYYFGTTAKKESVSMSPTAAPEPSTSPTSIPASPTAASANTKAVTAGLAQGTSFKPYTIQIPQGWTDVRENTETAGIDKLTITKNGYSLTIYQAAFGGGGCTYKDDPPSQMAQSFSDFADINGQSAQYRRSWNQDKVGQTISYTVCQKAEDNSYGSLTTFGGITVVSPNPADASILAEVDGMIASLKKN